MRRRWFPFLFILSLTGCQAAPPPLPVKSSVEAPQLTPEPSGNIFHGCPPEGDADQTTQSDPELNRLKNRVVAPHRYEVITLETLAGLGVPNGVSKRHRALWPSETLKVVRPAEETAVTVEGYLIGAKQEGPESCNCHIETDRDFHLWLASNPRDDRAEAIVVEVSPRIQAQHPNWRLHVFKTLVQNGVKVRISGWLMLDPEHPDQVGYTRVTLWEIHPILKIEVQRAGGWKEL